jgi:hypothetical protein
MVVTSSRRDVLHFGYARLSRSDCHRGRKKRLKRCVTKCTSALLNDRPARDPFVTT